jgi:hypothetical protein
MPGPKTSELILGYAVRRITVNEEEYDGHERFFLLFIDILILDEDALHCGRIEHEQ